MWALFVDSTVVTYLDHAATTAMHPLAVEALAAESRRLGNASAVHAAGRAARRVVEESRELLAARLDADAVEVVLTGGGTEADNLAVKGLFWSRTASEHRRRRVLISAVEHHAVLDPALWLAQRCGAELVQVPVDETGRVQLAALDAELAAAPDEVALVSVMWANNEVGTVQPVTDVVDLAHRHGVPVHVDAVQAVGQVPVSFATCGADALTVSGHKLGGPVGIGALLVRRGLEVTPLLHGGGQERRMRSGTVPVALARSFAVAVDVAVVEQTERAARMAGLRDRLVAGVLASIPDAVVRGPWPSGHDPSRGDDRLPGNAHLTFPGCDGEALTLLLDDAGVHASTGSACQAGVARPSHVLLAMGVQADVARGALRFSFGASSTDDDVDAVLRALPAVVERARAVGLVR